MSFNTALSGLRASNVDLQVTGNNIANAGTIGFKSSRVEFGDLYSASILGSAANTPGSGVSVQAIRQDFCHCNPKLTERDLDLAVNGAGFFVLSNQGEQLFTRAGSFGLTDDGYVVSNTGAYLQGYSANAEGNLNGILGNLRIDVTTQAPRQTTGVEAAFNLNSNESVLESTGKRFSTEGAAIGVTRSGLKEAVSTTLPLGPINIPNPAGIDFSASTSEFTINLAGSAAGNGSVTVTLDNSIAYSLQDVANLINSEIYGAADPINVQAVVSTDTNGNATGIVFKDMSEGATSTITVAMGAANDAANPLSVGIAAAGALIPGTPAANNGYASQSLDLRGPAGVVRFTSDPAASAAQTASELNALSGITASARTEASLSNFVPSAGSDFMLNGVALEGGTLAEIEEQINALTSSKLPGITATYDPGTSRLQIMSPTGADLKFSFSGNTSGSVTIMGKAGTPAQSLTAASLDEAVVVGGSISIMMEEGYEVISSSPAVGNLFAPLTDASFTPVTINAFDPKDQDTYNHATSNRIFDSLGNPHSLTQFFVKQPYDPADPSTSPNHWVMYVQIDGQNVGDPDYTLPSPQNTEPTMAAFNVHFKPDGTLNTALSDSMLISNWTPLGTDGEPIGGLGPLNVLQGGATPVVQPASSSNFEIDFSGSTQFGSPFGTEGFDQDGHATGRLASLDVDSTGIIFARFTNSEAQVLGQVALANFNNIEGLKPVGNTMWAQTFETGEAIIGAPGSSSLGNITAGALEESNVDLSEELVNLIIAQRNYQANAKTIETANATTQTIINLR